MACYYKGTGVPENEATMASIILGTSWLTARGVPVAGEYEVKNAQAMKIMDLFGVGGSFTEYYAMDFADDVVLMGHDGPGRIAIAEGRTKVVSMQSNHVPRMNRPTPIGVGLDLGPRPSRPFGFPSVPLARTKVRPYIQRYRYGYGAGR